MTRLLRGPSTSAAGTRRLDTPAPTLDETTRTLIADAEARGYDRGRSDGAADAATAARQAADRAAAAVTDAVAQLADHLAASADQQAATAVDVARTIAETLLGRELTDGGDALLGRIRTAVTQLDHGPFTVHVSTEDHDHISAGSLGPDVTVTPDPTMSPGDARIEGPWSGADLTVQTIVRQLAEAHR